MKGIFLALSLCIVWCFPACGGKQAMPSTEQVPVEQTLTDPKCKDEAVRLCLHRFPAPDVERKKYDACLTEEYAECLQ